MKGFLLDENISFEVIPVIKKLGYKVEHLKKLGKTGIRNGEVYQIATSHKLIIITRDTDFESIIKFNQHKIPGVIVIKLSDSTTKNIIRYLKKVFQLHREDFSTKHLFTVTDNAISIYPQ
jgi:predicted nuclease of predicted toxin-antitoxin system